MESAYFGSLKLENPDVDKRYQQKLKLINGLDPYTVDMESLNTSIDGVPPITNMDIVSYLVLTHSFYTKEQIRAYKGLQAYKYFESGFVVKAGTKRINDLFLLIGKVKHSQRLSAKPLEVWCIVGNGGLVKENVALKFHEEVIMPELLGRFFTKEDGEAKIICWCICKGVDDGSPMIECSGDDCEIKWFHFLCVGLVDTPDNVWYCQSCVEKQIV